MPLCDLLIFACMYGVKGDGKIGGLLKKGKIWFCKMGAGPHNVIVKTSFLARKDPVCLFRSPESWRA